MDKEEWEAKKDKLYPPDPEPEITVADMLTIFNHGRIGEIEFRNWLAEVYPSFARARRKDVDDWLEQEGNRLAAEKEALLVEEELELAEEEDV